MTSNDKYGPKIDYLGANLVRPECVLTAPSGAVYASNFDGGVTMLSPNGGRIDYLAENAPVELKTNGFAIAPDLSFLIANLGDDGGVWRLQQNGGVNPYVTEFEGQTLPPTNFVSIDEHGGVWITVSTRTTPRAAAYRPDIADGFILYVDKNGLRLAADGLGYTNEAHRRPGDDWLYVNETFAKRLSRFPITGTGVLGPRETVHEFGPGEFPDGLWFDETGGIIVTCIIANRVIRINREGNSKILLDDCIQEHAAAAEAAFQANRMGRVELDNTPARRLRNISSIAFGGQDRKDAYLGCLLDDRIVRFRSDYAGVAPPQWRWMR